MRRSAPKLWLGTVAALAVGALLLAGCGGGSGSSSSTTPGGANKATAPNAPTGSEVVTCKVGGAEAEELRAAAVDCATARETMLAWASSHACALGKGASRGSCALGEFRCQAVRSGQGVSVACARPGGDISFLSDSASAAR